VSIFHTNCILVLASAFTLAAPRARAQGAPPPISAGENGAQPKSERHFRPWSRARRGRIDFDKADIRDVAKFISEITGKNIILSDKARAGKLTIFSPAPVTRGEAYQAFLAALEVNALTVVSSGKFLKVVPQRDAKEMPGAIYDDPKRPPNDDQMVTAILRVQNGDAKEIHNVVAQLKNKNGFTIVYAPTSSIIVADVAANVRRLSRIVKLLDVSTASRERVWTIKVEHATARELADELNQVFAERSGQASPSPLRPAAPPPAGQPAATVIGETIDVKDLKVSRLIADDRTNQLIVVATEPVYLRLLALVARLDVKLSHDEGRVHVYYLQNADAEAMAGVLSGIISGAAAKRPGSTSAAPASRGPGASARLGGAAGTISASGSFFEGELKVNADKATNSLVVFASAQDFARLKKVIERLDIRRRQVFVEAVIMEVSTTKQRDLGVALSGGTTIDVNGQQVPIFGGTTLGKLSSLALDPSALTGLAALVRGPDIAGTKGLAGSSGLGIPSIGVVLRALQTTTDVNVLSTPHILTSDNEEAEILVGQNVPFITGGGYGGNNLAALSSLAGGSTPTSALSNLSTLGIGGFPNIQRQDVALTLKVTPQINASDFVKLKIEEEVADLAGDDPLRGPTTTRRKAKTVISVKDQQTVVIGGLVRDNYSEDVSKVPILGDIPILGYFFRNTTKRVEKRNLLLFLTPYIIQDPSDFQRIFKRKMQEHQEFLERFASHTKEYRTSIDYTKRHGLLEEVNQQVQALEHSEAQEARAKAEKRHKEEREKKREVVRGEEVLPRAPEKRYNE
jgi:general secretion pathway protein D